jgi:DNA-binding response OmpR family regulator
LVTIVPLRQAPRINGMVLDSLVLSKDPEVLRVIRPTLEKLSIEVEICHEARAGADILISDKFDAVIVDCDDLNGGLAVLQGLKSTPSNKNSVAFAILNGKRTTTQEAFGMGANFVLQKPISALNAARCFHAALNFMVKERRRYFRQPVKMLVKVVVDGKTLNATSTNISEGGMALMMRESLPKKSAPVLKFSLPGKKIHLEVEAEVAWIDVKGFAGFRFRNLPKNRQTELENWLDERMEQEFPGAKEKLAAEAETSN